LAFHGYDYNSNFDKIADLKRNNPDLPIWMTEICHAYVCGTPKTFPLPVYDFADGDFWGNQIFSDMESGVSAWIYWNMVLDENGGPWLISENHFNPKENIQHPVIIVNRKTKKVTYTGLYYYLTHFSKFVKPGSQRIGTHETMGGIRSVAFITKEGKVVTQVLNSTHNCMEVQLIYKGMKSMVQVAPLSITSFMWDK